MARNESEFRSGLSGDQRECRKNSKIVTTSVMRILAVNTRA